VVLGIGVIKDRLEKMRRLLKDELERNSFDSILFKVKIP
jgi:hypothetical protein